MEDKKNYPPLPSNYVTLAQLQDRWFKQKEKDKAKEEEIKQKQEQQLLQQEQHPKLHQHNRPQPQRRQPKAQQQAWRVIQTHGTGFGSAASNRHPRKFGPRSRNFSQSNRVTIEDSCEKRESLETKANIGDEKAGRDGKGKESKNKKKKRVTGKPRADKKEKKLAEDAAESTMVGAKEVENSDVQRVDDKMEIESELNDKSNNLMAAIEEKLGTVSMNSESDEKYKGLSQNGRLRRPYNSFRGSQRNYGGRFRGQEVQRPRGDKQIWVRKNEDSEGNVGGIEI